MLAVIHLAESDDETYDDRFRLRPEFIRGSFSTIYLELVEYLSCQLLEMFKRRLQPDSDGNACCRYC